MPIHIQTDKPYTILPYDPITYYANKPMTRTRLGRACSLDIQTYRLHRTATPTCRQDLAPLRLRNNLNNPSCRYAYNPVAGTILLPHKPISLVLIRLRAEHN